MTFKKRVAVVTGAAGRIGRALCRRFAADGVAVAMADICIEKAEELAAELRKDGADIRVYKMDICDSASVKDAAAAILKDFGKVDILINNAGAWPGKSLMEVEEDEWCHVIDMNLTGTYRVTKAFLPGMIEQHYGRIVNLASIAGEVGLPNYIAYATSKGGIISFTKTLAMETAHLGITVNAVSPGMITDQVKPCEGTWVGVTGLGDDIARMLEFLSADESGYITGVDYTIDGGRIIGPKACKV